MSVMEILLIYVNDVMFFLNQATFYQYDYVEFENNKSWLNYLSLN